MKRPCARWIGIGLAALAGLGLLAWPRATSWPGPSPAARQAMAGMLAQAVASARARNQAVEAWQAARVLMEGFPDTAPARQVAPHIPSLRAASARQASAGKWHYEILEGAGWGRLAQAQLPGEPAAGLPPSWLVVRYATNPHYRAVLWLPGSPLPAECAAPTGCLARVDVGARSILYRVLPVRDRPGQWVFPDFESVFALMGVHQPLALSISGSSLPATAFDVGGLDLPRLGAVPTAPTLLR